MLCTPIGPQLQKLASESQAALVLLKHLPLEPRHVATVVMAVRQAIASLVWSSRAAGLLFTQYFWFHQCFLLERQHLIILKVNDRRNGIGPIMHSAVCYMEGSGMGAGHGMDACLLSSKEVL